MRLFDLSSRGLLELHHSCPVTVEQASRLPSSQRRRAVKAHAQHGGSNADREATEGEQLATKFSKFVSTAGVQPLYRRPTPMIPPDTAVKSVLEALQRNDYPDEDAGVRTAYLFSKPHECETLVAGQGTPARVRSWTAREDWLPTPQFASMLHDKPYNVMIDCTEWQVVSQLRFPSRRLSNRAVQAIRVASAAEPGRFFTFTFCLERVEIGPYKGCWLVVGVRQGDYASIM